MSDNTRALVRIPLHSVIGSFEDRRSYEGIQDLAEQITTHGQDTPISVWLVPEGALPNGRDWECEIEAGTIVANEETRPYRGHYYWIEGGRRRVLAHVLNGLDGIDAVVKGSAETLDDLLGDFAYIAAVARENNARSQYTPEEQYQLVQLARLAYTRETKKKPTHAALATSLGLSRTYVSQFLAIGRIDHHRTRLGSDEDCTAVLEKVWEAYKAGDLAHLKMYELSQFKLPAQLSEMAAVFGALCPDYAPDDTLDDDDEDNDVGGRGDKSAPEAAEEVLPPKKAAEKLLDLLGKSKTARTNAARAALEYVLGVRDLDAVKLDLRL